MYAIIRQGNGKFYTTTVFGYYDYPKNKWDYKHRYCVVLNEEKNSLILQPMFAEKGLVSTVIFTDNDESNWKKINDNIMSVFFLPTEELYNWVLDQKVPDDLLQKCIAMDDEYATIENVTNGWCWFKARKMKYHLIPV